MSDGGERRGRLRDLPKRVGTALAYGAIMLGVVLFGRTLGWALLVAMIAVLALVEYYALTRETKRLPNEAFGVVAVAAMPLATAYFGTLGLTAVVTVLVVASLLWHVAFRQIRAVDTAVTVFGVVYIGFTLSHLVLVRMLDSGTVLLLATLFSVWLADILAYFVGSTVGRHKLAPRISPNKTWEGFVGGLVASLGVWTLTFYVTDTEIALVWHLVTGAVVAVAALTGDLAESRLKREFGVKDSGTLLPGHGGFLDRIDGLILVSVGAYYLLLWGGAL